ncbi:MAG: hypothetical protein U5R14_14910 [Gemmatimonadota bacterium]|nr:hypothetical protein [Gemmatimonadota bacterium]
MMRGIVLCCVLMSWVPGGGHAQDVVTDGLDFGGEAGTFSELYGISGAEQRRPTATGRLYFRPSVSLYGLVSVTGDFLLSTEGNRFGADARQDINRYALTPDWGWGRATVGDFSGSYSPLTYNGIRARGASLEVERGAFSVSAFGGRSRRRQLRWCRVGKLFADGGRRATGARRRGPFIPQAGRGERLGQPGSLPPPTDTTFADHEPDTAFVEDTLSVGRNNQFAVTPQRNLVVSVAGGLALLDDRVKLAGELAASGYTRDRRSDPIENPEILDRIPGIARALFTPRNSSSADYAYTLEGEFRP